MCVQTITVQSNIKNYEGLGGHWYVVRGHVSDMPGLSLKKKQKNNPSMLF